MFRQRREGGNEFFQAGVEDCDDGNDVDTVVVNGKILMRNRQVPGIDESEILDLAQRATDKALERTGLQHMLEIPDGFWGQSKYPES